MQVGHATIRFLKVATDNLIHNAHLVDRALASILLGHPSEYAPIELGNGLSRYLVWHFEHYLLSVPRISW
jgi:hypothetical protein